MVESKGCVIPFRRGDTVGTSTGTPLGGNLYSCGGSLSSKIGQLYSVDVR